MTPALIAGFWDQPVPVWFIVPLLIVGVGFAAFYCLILPVYWSVLSAWEEKHPKAGTPSVDDLVFGLMMGDQIMFIGALSLAVAEGIRFRAGWGRLTLIGLVPGIWLLVFLFVALIALVAKWVVRRWS